MEDMLIEESVLHYRKISRLSRTIEQAVLERNFDTVSSLCRNMDELQEEIKTKDNAILDLLRSRPDLKTTAQVQELLTLMRQILERNQHLAPQISGIMAVQRNELQKLKKGNTLLQGYRTAPQQTGGRISTSN